MELGVGLMGEVLSHKGEGEDEALMNGIDALKKDTPKGFLGTFYHMRKKQEYSYL